MTTFKSTVGEKSARKLAVSRIFRLFSGELSSQDEQEVGGWASESAEYQREFLSTAHLLADMEQFADSPAIQAILNEPDMEAEPTAWGGRWSRLAIAGSSWGKE